MRWQNTQFKASWPSPEKIAKKFLPEVAFVGRSNVGKSSLINALCLQNKLAKTSSTPGKTQHFVFFCVDDRMHLVDLPGYGYAKVSQSTIQEWEQIERYLIERPELIIVLIDSRHGLKEFDIQFLEWAKHQNKQLLLVLTKADKLTRTEKDRLSRVLPASLQGYEWMFSELGDARSIERLQKKIEHLCT